MKNCLNGIGDRNAESLSKFKMNIHGINKYQNDE